jgi:hypothetical protein
VTSRFHAGTSEESLVHIWYTLSFLDEVKERWKSFYFHSTDTINPTIGEYSIHKLYILHRRWSKLHWPVRGIPQYIPSTIIPRRRENRNVAGYISFSPSLMTSAISQMILRLNELTAHRPATYVIETMAYPCDTACGLDFYWTGHLPLEFWVLYSWQEHVPMMDHLSQGAPGLPKSRWIIFSGRRKITNVQ